jgi:hypothetical protein
MLLPVRPIYHGTHKHYSVENVLSFHYNSASKWETVSENAGDPLENAPFSNTRCYTSLLQRDGSYARLYDLQLREQEEVEARMLAKESKQDNLAVGVDRHEALSLQPRLERNPIKMRCYFEEES